MSFRFSKADPSIRVAKWAWTQCCRARRAKMHGEVKEVVLLSPTRAFVKTAHGDVTTSMTKMYNMIQDDMNTWPERRHAYNMALKEALSEMPKGTDERFSVSPGSDPDAAHHRGFRIGGGR